MTFTLHSKASGKRQSTLARTSIIGRICRTANVVAAGQFAGFDVLSLSD